MEPNNWSLLRKTYQPGGKIHINQINYSGNLMAVFMSICSLLALMRTRMTVAPWTSRAQLICPGGHICIAGLKTHPSGRLGHAWWAATARSNVSDQSSHRRCCISCESGVTQECYTFDAFHGAERGIYTYLYLTYQPSKKNKQTSESEPTALCLQVVFTESQQQKIEMSKMQSLQSHLKTSPGSSKL